MLDKSLAAQIVNKFYTYTLYNYSYNTLYSVLVIRTWYIKYMSFMIV